MCRCSAESSQRGALFRRQADASLQCELASQDGLLAVVARSDGGHAWLPVSQRDGLLPHPHVAHAQHSLAEEMLISAQLFVCLPYHGQLLASAALGLDVPILHESC